MQPYTLLPLFAAVLAAAVAGGMLARGAGERTNQLVAAMLACAAHWAACEAIWNNLDDAEAVVATIRISGLGWILLGPLVLHLVVEVQDDTRSALRRSLPWAYAVAVASQIVYLLSPLALQGAVRTSWGWSYTVGPVFPLVCAPTVTCAVLGIARWQGMLSRHASELERRQARQVLGAIVFMLVAALVTDVALPALDVAFPRLGSASVVLFCGFLAHGVTRHDYFVLAPGVFAARILEGLREGAALLRVGPQIEVANRSLAELVGLPRGRLRGVPLADFLPDLPGEAPGDLRGFETRLVSPAGRRIPVSVCSTVLHDEAHRPLGRIFAIRDMREMVALRDRLVTTGRLAAVGELAAGIVHEISNPVAYMLANLGELQRSWQVAARRLREAPEGENLEEVLVEGGELLEECTEGVERMARLVGSVRSFLHAGLGSRERADVGSLLDAALGMAEPKLRHRGAVVQKSYSETPPVLCAPQELKQLFLNLLMNAANAVGDFGVVRVFTQARDGRVLVRVEDDGHGMEPDVVSRLFDPVFDRKTAGGIGIGLPACYEIVRKHGGSLRVESEEGRGTTFHVELPAAGPDDDPASASVPAG